MPQPSLYGVALAHSQRRFGEMLECAQIAEDLNADLVTLADHPFVPNELETWTTLTTLAAHTRRITVASNVVGLALRPPAMLAKAAATLQLISGGRFTLGIGAGDPAGSLAFGGPPLSTRESVDALDEALGLIRRLLEPGPAVDHHGRFYQLTDAHFSPKPDPAIPIWVGAFGPRMLAVTGRHGDGWIPTNAYLELADVPDMQNRVDKAATSAGRDPGQIRRIFNIFGQITDAEPMENGKRLVGSVDFWVETLRDYRDRLGFDSFIIWPHADRAEQARLFLEQVRPQVEA